MASPMNASCDHGVLTASKTLDKLTAKCEGCKHRKKWPWVKMMKCYQCKKLWHLKCVPSKTGAQARFQRECVEKAICPEPGDEIERESRSCAQDRLHAGAETSLHVDQELRDNDAVENSFLPTASDPVRTLSLEDSARHDRAQVVNTPLFDKHDATMVDYGIDYVHKENVPNESQMCTERQCTEADEQTVLKFSDTFVSSEENPSPEGSCAVNEPAVSKGYKNKWRKKPVRPKGVQIRPEDVIKKLNELKLTCDSPNILIHDILMYQNKKIDYDLISENGQVHCPEFTFSAKCDDIVVYGNGPSKKEAKKNAAIALFNQYLRRIIPCNDMTSSTLDTSQSLIIDHEKSVLEAKLESNPIGVLQELCMARRWTLPQYEYIKVFTDSKWYIVTCFLQAHSFRGEGSLKQEAKRQAARLMYDQIMRLSQEPNMTCSVKEKKITSEYQSFCVAPSNDNKSIPEIITTLLKNLDVSDTLKCMELLFNQLKSSTNPCINNLRSISELKTGSVDVLNNISCEEGFNVTYVEIAKDAAKSKALVQVSITPLLVIVGTGDTMKAAQESAAFTALTYIKLMLDK